MMKVFADNRIMFHAFFLFTHHKFSIYRKKFYIWIFIASFLPCQEKNKPCKFKIHAIFIGKEVQQSRVAAFMEVVREVSKEDG
jgi:hypothetical protein